MTIFFFKGLTGNSEIRKTSGFCPISGDWGRVRDTKSGTNVSNKMLVNAAKCQGYSFYLFWVIKEKPTGEGTYLPPPATEITPKKATFLYDLVVHTKTMLSLVWRWTFYFHQLSWNKTLRIRKTFFYFFHVGFADIRRFFLLIILLVF